MTRVTEIPLTPVASTGEDSDLEAESFRLDLRGGGVAEVTVESPVWADLLAALPPATISEAINRCLATDPPVASGREIALSLTSDKQMCALNGRFRGRSSPTNVLSFPSLDHERLGDIALAGETVITEAKAADLAPADHALHLIIHGVLHLLGHDHVGDDEAMAMQKQETAIMTAMGLADPYAASYLQGKRK